MLQAHNFRKYFARVANAAPNTQSTYNTYLNKLDRALAAAGKNGLDEALESEGVEAVIAWVRTLDRDFDPYPSNLRSAIKRYAEFFQRQGKEDEIADADMDASETAALNTESRALFDVEKDMQAAVRRQLDRLESGLVAADGGFEQSVATGRIDILARDAQGKYVIIELKAGRCPNGTIEQALGYAQALSEERPDAEDSRIIIIAGEFSDRMTAASKRVPSLSLKTYQFSLQFEEVG